MFTGIIEKVAKVMSLEERRGQMRLMIASGFKDLELGESVAVNGVCLTVAEKSEKGEALFFVSEESLERSNLKNLQPESEVNLERAMKLDGRFSGHLVQGHVDTAATLLNVMDGPEHHKLSFAMDSKYGRYCVEKGSITLNGVSLTINSSQETTRKEFIVSVLIIPHTWKNTNFSSLKPGEMVNVEVDIIAKYVERLCLSQLPSNNSVTANS